MKDLMEIISIFPNENIQLRYNCDKYLVNIMDYTKPISSLVLNTYMYKLKSNQRWVNSLRLSDAYMHQYNIQTLVQIMACRLFGAKPLSEPMLPYCQLDAKEHTSVTFYLRFNIFIEGNALENVVCKMATILSQPQCFKIWSAD